jgi:hypothetical protein
LFKSLKVPVVEAKRAILVCYALLFAVGSLYVPWNIRLPSGSTERFKRGFLWSPPQGYRTIPPVTYKKTYDMFWEWSNAAIKAAENGDLKRAKRDSEMAKALSTELDRARGNWERAMEEYERTTLVVNWGDLFLELVALTALCVAALIVVTQKPKSNPDSGSEVN